jgi:hypothetical protein
LIKINDEANLPLLACFFVMPNSAALPDIDGNAEHQQNGAIEDRFGAAAIKCEDREDEGDDLDE